MTTREPTGRPDGGPYRGCIIAVGTRHGKALQMAHAFSETLGACLLTPPNLDTDQFGTFSGEVPRNGTALAAARAKAELAMDVSGLRYGLASEASYGPLAATGLPGHEELLIFLDDSRSIEVVEGYRTTQIPGSGHCAAEIDDLPSRLTDGLPAQALIVRPARGGVAADIVKGITHRHQLRIAVAGAARRSTDGLALVDPDLRAHHNPGRRLVLTRLAATLARRLATHCPACDTPGFGRTLTRSGLPCGICGTPTSVAATEVHECPACTHRRLESVSAVSADAIWCPQCNP
ncbi:DUF6671 family protein [Mycolicibacterium hodleri]|uniref:DUF6671 domain-containing protein n=1 Tax=Mycolicibacterium hodleri TaxID=49897 RepID=A0A502E7V9_9MYCO|nr:DUF6671 family protein [Mycolicibacterium hodleri]TPG32530.1 hypothetical protein EAH80_19925 [Mycolicibacterium hodleri]